MNPLGIYTKLIAAGVAVVVVLSAMIGMYAYAKHVGYAAAAERYKIQAAEEDARRTAVAAPIAEKQVVIQTQIKTVTKTIIKEVPVYVKATDCPSTGGFRLLHDAAADGVVPDPARITDAAPATASDVADTIAKNYGTYHEVAAELVGLQDWVRAQKALKK